MKVVCIVYFMLISLGVLSQVKKQKGFAIAEFELLKYTDLETVIVPSLELGFNIGKITHAAVGAKVYQFPGTENTYVPFYLDLSVLPTKNKINPMGSIKIGYGIYDSKVGIYETMGGLYLSPSLGAFVPVKNTSGIIVRLSYVNSAFINYINNKKDKSYNQDGFSIGVGFKIG